MRYTHDRLFDLSIIVVGHLFLIKKYDSKLENVRHFNKCQWQQVNDQRYVENIHILNKHKHKSQVYSYSVPI